MSSEGNVPDYNLAKAVKFMEDMGNETIQACYIHKEKSKIVGGWYNSLKIITKPDIECGQKRFDQITLEGTAIFYDLQFQYQLV